MANAALLAAINAATGCVCVLGWSADRPAIAILATFSNRPDRQSFQERMGSAIISLSHAQGLNESVIVNISVN